MTQDNIQSVLFPSLFHKPVVASFDQPDSSSDGGAILLKAIDSELNLTERLAACIRETRDEGKIVHPLLDLFRQRVYGIACGYPDCNDADRLADVLVLWRPIGLRISSLSRIISIADATCCLRRIRLDCGPFLHRYPVERGILGYATT